MTIFFFSHKNCVNISNISLLNDLTIEAPALYKSLIKSRLKSKHVIFCQTRELIYFDFAKAIPVGNSPNVE